MIRNRSQPDIQQSLVDLAVKYADLSPNTQSPDLPSILPSQRRAVIRQINQRRSRRVSIDDSDVHNINNVTKPYNGYTDIVQQKRVLDTNMNGKIPNILNNINHHTTLQNIESTDTTASNTPVFHYDHIATGGSPNTTQPHNTLNSIITAYKSQNSSGHITPIFHSQPNSKHTTVSNSPSNTTDERLLSSYEIVCLCFPAAAVQIGWCIGEALLIPYLLSLGISATIANLIFLINPIFGVLIHPIIGKWSDNCNFKYGKRTPFIFCLHIIAACGMLGVMRSEQITKFIGIQPFDSDNNASTVMLILLFISFGVMDFAHDLLLLPARALLNDVLPSEQTDYGNSCFSLMTSAGACIGLIFILLPLESIYPLRLVFTQPITATFALSFILLNVSNLVSTVMAIRLSGIEPTDTEQQRTPYQTGLHGELAMASAELVMSDIKHTHDANIVRQKSNSSIHINTDLNSLHKPNTNSNEQDDGLLSLFQVLRTQPWQLTMVWLTQFSWWYGVLHITLWWTSYVTKDVLYNNSGHSVRLATVGLLVNAITALITSIALSRINRWFGPVAVYYTACIVYGCILIAIYMLPHTYICTIIVMFVLGLCMPAFLSNPYVLIEYYADGEHNNDTEESNVDINKSPNSDTTPQSDAAEMLESSRGLITALFNVTMVLAQIVVGSTSGVIIDALGSISQIYFISGTFMLCTVTLVGFYTAIRNRRESKELAAHTIQSEQQPLIQPVLKLPPHLRRRVRADMPLTPTLKAVNKLRPFAVGRAAVGRVPKLSKKNAKISGPSLKRNLTDPTSTGSEIAMTVNTNAVESTYQTNDEYSNDTLNIPEINV